LTLVLGLMLKLCENGLAIYEETKRISNEKSQSNIKFIVVKKGGGRPKAMQW